MPPWGLEIRHDNRSKSCNSNDWYNITKKHSDFFLPLPNAASTSKYTLQLILWDEGEEDDIITLLFEILLIMAFITYSKYWRSTLSGIQSLTSFLISRKGILCFWWYIKITFCEIQNQEKQWISEYVILCEFIISLIFNVFLKALLSSLIYRQMHF